MEWQRQSYAQSLRDTPFVKQQSISDRYKHNSLAVPLEHGWNSMPRHRMRQTLNRYRYLALATLIAATLINAVNAHAREPARMAQQDRTGLRMMTEADLRHASARGFPDHLFDKRSIFASKGNVIEMLGATGRLLNPVLSLVDANSTFQDVLYNPTDPSIVVDRNGTALVRLLSTIGDITFRNAPLRGANGASVGSVMVRGVDFRGTVVKVSRH